MMKIILIPLIVILMLSVSSCGEINTGDSGNTGDTGNTGNSGDTGDTCHENNKFCHPHDGLNWSDASSDSMDWDNAITYCENLGGRLPTISELRTLIQNCPTTETGGKCGITDSCLSSTDCWNDSCDRCEYDESGKYSVFGDTYWFWSSSELLGNADFAWYVYFSSGYVYSYSKDGNNFVRCVQ